MSSAVASACETNPARVPCAERERSLRISFIGPRSRAVGSGREPGVTRLLAEQDAIDDTLGPGVDRDALGARRVDGLHGEARGRLADDTPEVDALDDRLDVDGGGDVVDGDLLD